MSQTPNLFTAFPSIDMSSVVEAGDVALLIKKNGQTMALNFGYDAGRLALPAEEQNDDDRAMILQGQKLFALCLAAQNEQIMALLLRIAADPDVVDLEALGKLATRH